LYTSSSDGNNSTKISVSDTSLYHQKYINIYTELKYFLDNNPINNETQLKIEKFLLNNGLNILNDKPDQVRGLYNGLYSQKTSRFLLKFKPLLSKKIQDFIKFKNLYQNEPTTKSKHKLYLVDIIEKTGLPYILTVLFGRFIKILSNSRHNLTFEKNLVLNIALDLSKDLIREYLSIMYNTHLKQLIDEGAITNHKEYTYTH